MTTLGPRMAHAIDPAGGDGHCACYFRRGGMGQAKGSPTEAELDEFERAVSSSRRRVGLAMAGLGALGACLGAFLRVQSGLGHEQWAPTATATLWAGVAAIALLFGHARGRPGPGAIGSMSEGSKLRVGMGVTLALLATMASAAVDCGIARAQSRAVGKVYPTIVEMRFDADGGLLLFGIVILAALRPRLYPQGRTPAVAEDEREP